MSTNTNPSYTFGSYNSAFFTTEYLNFPTAQGSETIMSLFTKSIESTSTTTSATMFDTQITGNLSIATASNRSGAINIGSKATSGIGNTINIGSALSTVSLLGDITIGTSASTTVINGSSLTLGSASQTTTMNGYLDCGSNAISANRILSNSIETKTAGVLQIGPTNATSVFCTPSITCAQYIINTSPSTLGKTNMGYYVNYAMVEFTAVGNNGLFYYYAPNVNTATSDAHYLNAGNYLAYINYKYLTVSSPLSVVGNVTLNICSGTSAGTMVPTVAQSNTAGSTPSPSTSFVITSNIIEYTHTCAFYLSTASYVNLEFILSTNFSITSGTLTHRLYGNIIRIG